MSLAKGVLGAFAGGCVGAALWIGVAFATGRDFSILSIILGGAVGFGMGMGNRGRGGSQAGVLAAVVAVVCILGSKLGVAYYVAQHELASIDTNVSEEEAREELLMQVATEFEREGRQTSYVDEDELPPEVWAEADRRWHAMSLHQREEYRVGLEMKMREGVDEAIGAVAVGALIWSFGPFGWVCLFLAASTAYKTASTRMEKGQDQDDVDVDQAPQAPAMFRMAPPPPAPPAAPLTPALAAAPHPPAMQPKQDAPTGLGVFARLGQEAPTAAPAPKPMQAEKPVKSEEPPANGQGIFARLGQEPSSTPAPAKKPQPAPMAPPRQEVGLINLDLGDAA